MKKRYIIVPAKIMLLDENDDPIKDEKDNYVFMTFPEFIRGRTSDESFGKDMDSIESAMNIRNSIRGKSPGDTWEIDLDDWEKLVNVVKNPRIPYNPRVAVAIVPFMRHVTEARTDKPTILSAEDTTQSS